MESVKEYSNAPESQGDTNLCTCYAAANGIENRLRQVDKVIDFNDELLGQQVSMINGKNRDYIKMNGFNLYIVLSTLTRYKILATQYKLSNLRSIDPIVSQIMNSLENNHSIVCSMNGTVTTKNGIKYWAQSGNTYHAMNIVQADEDGVMFENSWTGSEFVRCDWEVFKKAYVQGYIFDIVEEVDGEWEEVFTGSSELSNETKTEGDEWKYDYYSIMEKEVPFGERMFEKFNDCGYAERQTKCLLEIHSYRYHNPKK